jgi:preprotein translocase subunit SecE
MNIIGSTTTFLKEVRLEAKKVNWLTRKELIQYTLLVIGFMVVMAMYFGALDASYSLGLEQLIFNR